MSGEVEVVLIARTEEIGRLVQDCAEGKLEFDELCERVAAVGYRTTSLYEMVRAAEVVTVEVSPAKK